MDSHRALLIRLVASRSSFKPLLDRGLTYSQISVIIEECLKDGYLTENCEGELVVTEFGITALKDTNNKTLWISPLEESRCNKLNVNEVYVPTLDSTFFIE